MSYQDLITCPICLENYTKPRYLPCLHTYCEECLTDYISTAYNKEENGFSCPTCRMPNKVEVSENISPKMAAAGFPINHMIMTLLDQRDIENKDVSCNPCSKRGRKEPGKFWCYSCSAALCEACGEFHTSLPILADHRIAPLEDSSDVPVLASTAHDVCEIHAGKKLEMFCQDHDVACCATCTMVNHRKCETVITLFDAAKSFKETSANTTESVVKEIQSLIEQFDVKIADCSKEYETLESATESRTKEIQEFSDKIINHADKLKSDFDLNLAEAKSKKMMEIQNRKKELLNMQNMLSNCEGILNAVDEKCSKIQMLTIIPNLIKLRDESSAKLEEIKQNPITQNIEVVIDQRIEDCAKVESLGKLIEN